MGARLSRMSWIVTVVAGLACLLPAAPAAADGTLWVQVDPSTVTAGGRVTVTASCDDNNRPQSATSTAFGGPVTLLPKSGVLQGTAKVPRNTKAQGYTVTLACAAGGRATTTLWVVAMAAPTKGPATGGGGAVGHGAGTALAGGLAALVAGAGLGAVGLRRSRRTGRTAGS